MSIKNSRSESKEILGLNRITKKRLLELCKKDKLYQTPSLNDVLYLHYQGFQCIECLEDYTELKCLWLECNALSEIQGLENQAKLKCLFLQSNLIKKIENLEFCKELDTINLSQNQIRKIENINSDVLPVLNTLNLSSNYIKDCEGLRELENCKNLSVVDLSNNRIDDILVVKIFAKIPELKVLILQGNPVVSKIPQYRKTLILECKNLTYLDSRPVFPKDRACAEAWKRGGYQEERKENERWNRKERKKIRDGVNATIRMRNKNRKPEDHLTLLVSSDSDDESAATKRNRQQQELDSGVSMELGMWDEVAGDDNKSETTSSSDMNVSSSTSVISTTDSNVDGSNASSKEEDGSERFDEEIKISNFSMNRKDNESCHLEETKNLETVPAGKQNLEETSGKRKGLIQNLVKINLESVQKPLGNTETIHLNECEITKDTGSKKEQDDFNQADISMKEAKEMKLNKEEPDVNICSQLDRVCVDASVSDAFEQKDGSVCLEQSEKLEQLTLTIEPNTIPGRNTSDESEGETYDHTIEAIYRVTMNNLSHTAKCPPDSEKRVHLQIEANDEIYEPFGEMEEAMKTMITKEDMERENIRELNSQSDEVNLAPIKTQSQLEFEQECLHVNEEVRKDFEQMSSNMDVAIAEFQRDQEERLEVIEALFSQKEANKEISSGDSSDENKEAYEKNLRIERMVSQWDRETKLRGGKRNESIVSIELEENILKHLANYSFEGSQQKVVQLGCNDQTDGIKQLDFESTEDFPNVIEFGKNKNIFEQENLFGNNDGVHRNEEKSKYEQKQKIPKEVAGHTSEVESTKSDDISLKPGNKMDNLCCILSQKENEFTEEVFSRADMDDRKQFLNKFEEKVSNVRCREEMENRNNTEDTTKSHGSLKEFENGQECTKVLRVGEELITGKIHISLKTEPGNGNLAKIHDEEFYKPLDVTSLTRVSNEALESFEKEAKHLKDILQKLEDDNDQMFSNLNCETQVEKEEKSKGIEEKPIKKSENTHMLQELKRENNEESHECNQNGVCEELKGANGSAPDDMQLQEKLKEDSIDSICKETVGDIIQSLDLQLRKPKSFQFPMELESKDHTEYEKELPLSKTIRNVIDSFNVLFRDTTSPNPDIPTTQSCGMNTAPLSSYEKTSILNELVNSPNLKQFNQDTHESLDALLAEHKEERSKQVRKIVDTVYAQKDRYNDSIELIDGKLMVVNKDTAELTELPQSGSHPFCEDSDTDYDTAESGEEQDGACCSKPRVRRVNVWPRKWGPYTLPDYKPAEVIMRQVLCGDLKKVPHRNQQANEESDKDDEYYSLDAQNIANVYGNIDREVFDAMTFDHLSLSEQDESHIVQCVRSYEELKHMFKTQKAERGLTPEENELLEKMVECRHSREKVNQQQDAAEIPHDDVLLRKLMERNREYSVKDKEYPKPLEILNEVETEITSYKKSREPIKILEYKPTINVGDINAPGEGPQEMGVVQDARFVENECTEIYGDDVLTFIHKGFAENSEEEVNIFSLQGSQDLKSPEFLKSKKVKENLNHKEQHTENKVAEIGNVEPFSGTVLFSEDEKNDIEYNVDVEGIMRKKELVLKETSSQCIKNNPNKLYPLAFPNTDLNSVPPQAVDVSQRIALSGSGFEDQEKISRDLEENSKLEINELNEVKENMCQLKETTDEFQTISNSSNKSENMSQVETADICPIDAQSQASAATGNTFYNSKKIEQISQVYLKECHTTEVSDVGVLECSLQIQACENNSQQYLKSSEFLPDSSHMQVYYESVSSANKIDSPSQDTEVECSEIFHSNLKDHSINLPIHSEVRNQIFTPLSTIPAKEVPNIDLLKYNSTELLECDYKHENLDPQPEKKLTDIENKSPEMLEVDILECNLEILGCNEDVIDTITVNAEIHYEN